MKKLSELNNEALVVGESEYTPITVLELHHKINKNELNEEPYYLVQPQVWKPDAQEMIKGYIRSESYNMYQDWDEVAMDCVDCKGISSLQNVLDEIFNDDVMKNFYTFVDVIKIDTLDKS